MEDKEVIQMIKLIMHQKNIHIIINKDYCIVRNAVMQFNKNEKEINKNLEAIFIQIIKLNWNIIKIKL